MKNAYTDKKGYFRWKNSDKLVHRGVAYKHIYEPNKYRFPLYFKQYIVHHIDGDKKNNKISNLQIMTSEDHSKHHGHSSIKFVHPSSIPPYEHLPPSHSYPAPTSTSTSNSTSNWNYVVIGIIVIIIIKLILAG